jgi:aminoglycoside/choline kinase family phosphotransferase
MQSSPDRQQALRRFADLHLHGRELDIVPASSDAGYRSYWRVHAPGEPSRVLMDAPPDKIDCGPFLRIGALLAEHGLPVPEVLASDLEQGFLLLSDLGERTCLETIQAGAAPGPYVEAAIALLVGLQQVPAPDWLPPYDRGPLEAELDLFVDWYLGRHRGIVLSDADRATWLDARARLVDSALAQPQVLVHRDYMLRNLMPPTGASALPGLLDFQDAGRGPIAYDPICLVKDAFASWPADDVETWLRSYHAQATAAGVPVPAWAQFRRDADWIGMQRHLKVIGIFARIAHRDGKPRYLTDVPRFFGYLFEVLPAYPEFAALADLLARVAPTDAD